MRLPLRKEGVDADLERFIPLCVVGTIKACAWLVHAPPTLLGHGGAFSAVLSAHSRRRAT